MKHKKRLGFLTSFLCLIALLLTSCDSRMTIITDIDERSANEIVVFLNSKGIAAAKTVASTGDTAGGGPKTPLWNIVVEPEQATDAMAILNYNGLPRTSTQTLLGLFGESGLVPTDMQEQIRFQAGLSEQISGTIRKIDGVLDADVQISFPPNDSTLPITASVYVKHQGVLDNPNSHLVTKIRRLVSGSVSGLKLDNVTVISDRSRFTDVTFGQPGEEISDTDREYVALWSVVVAKDSVGSFQFLFFSFFFVLFILVALLIWLSWKIFPVLSSMEGGWKSLFKLKTLKVASKEDNSGFGEFPGEGPEAL